MTKPPFRQKPACQLVLSTLPSNQTRALESALVPPPRESATGPSSAELPAGKIVDEDDLVDPAGLIEDVIQRLFCLLDELEEAAGSVVAPASALELLSHGAELLAMRLALRVGMDIEEWKSIFFRTAEISCEIGSVREELDEYLSRGGFGSTDQSHAKPAGQ